VRACEWDIGCGGGVEVRNGWVKVGRNGSE
jgi:hypothetical protein